MVWQFLHGIIMAMIPCHDLVVALTLVIVLIPSTISFLPLKRQKECRERERERERRTDRERDRERGEERDLVHLGTEASQHIGCGSAAASENRHHRLHHGLHVVWCKGVPACVSPTRIRVSAGSVGAIIYT